MAQITKEEIKQLLSEQTDAILEAVDGQLQDIKTELREIKEDVRDVRIILDGFVATLKDLSAEFVIIKAQLDKIKKVIKEKLGVEISAQ